MTGTFYPPPGVSDPDMHHGMCVTHVPWYMPGSLTSGFLWSRWQGKVPGIPGACATRNFTYLVRGPWLLYKGFSVRLKLHHMHGLTKAFMLSFPLMKSYLSWETIQFSGRFIQVLLYLTDMESRFSHDIIMLVLSISPVVNDHLSSETMYINGCFTQVSLIWNSWSSQVLNIVRHFSLSWETTCIERPQISVVALYKIHCTWLT